MCLSANRLWQTLSFCVLNDTKIESSTLFTTVKDIPVYSESLQTTRKTYFVNDCNYVYVLQLCIISRWVVLHSSTGDCLEVPPLSLSANAADQYGCTGDIIINKIYKKLGLDESHEFTQFTEMAPAINFGIYRDFSRSMHFRVEIHKFLM